MSDIVAFITAQLDADEQTALLVTEGTRGWTVNDWVAEDGDVVFAGSDFEHDITEGRFVAHAFPLEPLAPVAASIAAYIARHDPARVLADIAAKRAILALHAPIASDVSPVGELLCEAETVGDNHYHSTPWPCPTLCILATIHAGHPDYDESWRP